MKKIIIILSTILFIIYFLYLENNHIVTTSKKLYFENLPKEFDNFKIIQISDLHNKKFGHRQKRLVNKIKKLNPDIIFITGDIVDYKKYDLSIVLELIDEIKLISTIYFVNGNHEWWSGKSEEVRKELEKREIKVLNNQQKIINKGNSIINIIGFDDLEGIGSKIKYIENMERFQTESFTLVLSHRPEFFKEYVKNGFNLVFTGHAHGGQFRIPFIGGLIAPNQGFLPKYTAGVYKSNKTKMVVNRGLGNSIIPQRIFNKPEIIKITLKRK